MLVVLDLDVSRVVAPEFWILLGSLIAAGILLVLLKVEAEVLAFS